MYIVPMGWLYVALMMAVAEATNDNGTVLGGVITFVLYGVGPVLLVLYLMGSPARHKAIKANEAALATTQATTLASTEAVNPPLQQASQSAQPQPSLPASAQPASAQPASAQPSSVQPDTGSHAPATAEGDSVASVRKEL